MGVLEEIAEKLAEQNGHMARALGRDHHQKPELIPDWSLSA
jgi:hypothetical protein